MKKLKILEKQNNFLKIFLENFTLVFLVLIISIGSLFLVWEFFPKSVSLLHEKIQVQEQFNVQQEKIRFYRISKFSENVQELKKNGCVEIIIADSEDDTCKLTDDPEDCLITDKLFFTNPVCKYFNTIHVKLPEAVKAWYYTAYAGLSNSKINNLINNKEINAVLIDVKEVDGKVYLSDQLKKNLKRLHQNGIYTIGRIVVFKDNKLVANKPELAVKKKSNPTEVWQDYAHKKWLDPLAKEVWDYNKDIARRAYLAGFDEINFDYIRFPSDGQMSDTFYPFSKDILAQNSRWGKTIVLDKFFHYITSELKKEFPEIIISADLFGYTATNYDDLNIGQILESAVLYFDFVAPMAYPSHYSQGHLGFEDGPDNHPYEVIHHSLRKAQEKIVKLNQQIKTAQESKNNFVEIRPGVKANKNISELEEISTEKLRFWLQAFTCTWCKSHQPYTAEKINEQKKAITDLGGDSWMLWNAAARYPQ